MKLFLRYNHKNERECDEINVKIKNQESSNKGKNENKNKDFDKNKNYKKHFLKKINFYFFYDKKEVKSKKLQKLIIMEFKKAPSSSRNVLSASSKECALETPKEADPRHGFMTHEKSSKSVVS